MLGSESFHWELDRLHQQVLHARLEGRAHVLYAFRLVRVDILYSSCGAF